MIKKFSLKILFLYFILGVFVVFIHDPLFNFFNTIIVGNQDISFTVYFLQDFTVIYLKDIFLYIGFMIMGGSLDNLLATLFGREIIA